MQELQEKDTEYMTQFNMYTYGSVFEMPVIFICGSEDWLTKYTIEDYYALVKAPYKKLVYIQNAGHDTIQVAPNEFYETFNEAMKDARVK